VAKEVCVKLSGVHAGPQSSFCPYPGLTSWAIIGRPLTGLVLGSAVLSLRSECSWQASGLLFQTLYTTDLIVRAWVLGRGERGLRQTF